MYKPGAALDEQGILSADKDVWDQAQALWDAAQALSYFAERRTEGLKKGYIVVEELADAMRALARVRRVCALNHFISLRRLPLSS